MNIKSISIICLMLWFSNNVLSQQRNMMQEEVVKVAGITDDNQIYSLTPDKKQITRTYFDGLGRVIQTNAVKASPLQKDVIQNNKYDNLGRQTIDYLPYVSSDGSGNFHASAATEQLAFYSNGTADKVVDDTSPFKQAVFENSPLQRLLQEGSLGNNFQPGQHNKSVSYRQNTTADGVINWSTAGVNAGTYSVGSLDVTVITDEAGKQSHLFKSLDGKTVLKREVINEVIAGVSETKLDTYYIYNEAGALIWIVPPKAVAVMKAAANWTLSQATVTNLLFNYIYDERGRLIEKKVPESGSIYFIYDPLDRLVLIQDANLRATNKWNYVKYDVKNRAISQGVYLDATRTNRAAMQTYVNGLNYSTTYYEKRSTTLASRYYTNLVFPTTGITPLAYGYYENYDINQDGTADYSYQGQGLTGEATPTSNTRGVLTAVSKRSIGAGLADIWLTNVIFYDKKGNVIQTRSNNQITAAVSDTRTNVLDFIGKATTVKTVKVTGTTTTVLSSYTYDHTSRLKTIDDTYNGGTPVRIAAYEYNELGQLVDKKLHSTNSGSSYLQSVDFRFNINGYLTSINNSTLTSDAKNDDLNDVFGMEILYDIKDSQLNNTSYYDGLVSAMKWRAITPSNTNPNQKAYRFDYNTQKQLKNALYSNKTVAATTWTNDGAFDEKSITYDHNGNISALKRNALLSGTIGEVDNLTYTYTGNQLSNVADGTGGNYATVGFKNPTASTAVYTYDAAGNMTTDPKKGLALTYNLLNKTEKITVSTSVGRYITYTYDSFGSLLRKQAFDNNVLQKTIDYVDGFVYENNVLAYFGMAEGRVRNTGAALKPEYMITDQQGNVRVNFEENAGVAAVRQENSYYPFGLIMPGGTTPSAPNKNLYNAGSEWQNDFADMPDLYNTFFRNYDPALGRFVAVDPRADESHSVSPFQYALNSPLVFNDPLGDISASELNRAIDELLNSKYGGYWQSDGFMDFYSSDNDVFSAGSSYLFANGVFGSGGKEYAAAARAFNSSPHTGGDAPEDVRFLPGVRVIAGNQASYLDAHDEIQRQMDASNQGTGWAKATLAFIAADIAIPEPTDAAWPKWVGYAVAGTAAAAYLSYNNSNNNFYYVTYTKTNAQGRVYVGRSSGSGSPYSIVTARDANHHMEGYGPAVLSTAARATIPGGYPTRIIDPSYWFTRGAEQLQIEYYRKLGISGNSINGISPYNPNISKYLDEFTTFKF